MDWSRIASELRRVETAARSALKSLPEDAGGPAGDPFLRGLIRNLQLPFMAAGGPNRTSTFDAYEDAYKGPFFDFASACLDKLEKLGALPPGAIPREQALGKAIQRAIPRARKKDTTKTT